MRLTSVLRLYTIYALTGAIAVFPFTVWAGDAMKSDKDANAYVKEITWQENRKLTWDDFKGSMPPSANENAAAATFCGIACETNDAGDNKRPEAYVYNTFYPQQSWVREDGKTSEILAHEQGHFDICELYTRRLRDRISAANITGRSFRQTLHRIYNEVTDEYESRQRAYETETEHGVNAAEQQRWQMLIASELSNTKND